jgi:hypothetical protein
MANPSPFSLNPEPQFATTEYAPKLGSQTRTGCKALINGPYCRINGDLKCTKISRRELPTDSHARFVRGILFGKAARALGTSLVTQAIDGVKVGGHVCRIIAEEQAHADGDHETNGHPQIRQRCGNRRDESPHQCGYAGAD